jgi:CMP-N-acetylneuraminic acid synthetase
MYKDKTILAIIPARGGSKRLPNKNILNLCGKPLVAWTIESALNSKYISSIILSSDDDRILEIGKKYNINAVKRPQELSNDTAKSVDVVLYHLYQVKNKFDYVILLQPTSPLRTSKHIDESIEYLFEKNADAVVSVCEMEHSPLWANTLPEDLCMKNFLKDDVKDKRSQDLPKYYRLNGSIYIAKVEKLLEQKTFFLKENIYGYLMDKYSSVDIDDEFDFKIAECIMKTNKDGTHD